MSQESLKFLDRGGAGAWAPLIFNGNTWIPAANLIWNDTLKRLGINVASPNVALEVNSGTAGNSGIRTTEMTSATAPTANVAPVGINASGDLVVYQAPQMVVDVSRTSSYTVGTSYSNLIYNTPNTNIRTQYNTSNGVFTPDSAGLYVFYINNKFTVNADAQVSHQLLVNSADDTEVGTGTDGGTLSGNIPDSISFATPLLLAANAAVTLSVIRTGTVTPLVGNGQHRMKIVRIA